MRKLAAGAVPEAGRSGGGRDYGADHHSRGITLPTCRQRVFPHSVTETWTSPWGRNGKGSSFLLLPGCLDWAKKEGEWEQ